MMIRKAILIGNNTGLGAPTYLEGVNKDLLNYHAYLTSDIGGKWYNDEIIVLHNQTRKEILNAIAKCNGTYSFVVFTGHGYINSRDGKTYVCVKDDAISESELNTYLPKRSLILDCCREITTIAENFDGSRPSARLMSRGGTITGALAAVRNARNKFDDALYVTDEGQFTGYACLENRLSSDNPSAGGAFSATLMRVGIEFGSNLQRTSNLRIIDAVIRTKSIMENDRFTNQTPDWRVTGGTITTAPFAVANWKNPRTGLFQ